MFGKQSQFNGWDLASAEHAPGFFDDLDAMLQEPVGLLGSKRIGLPPPCMRA